MGRAEARVAVAAAVAAAAWLACARPAELTYEERLEAAPAPERHAIQSARLAEHMRRLERTRTERLPQALDLDAREARMRDVVAEVAPIGRFEDLSSVTVTIAGRDVRVLALDQLIAVKEATGRPKDAIAVHELRAIAEMLDE